MKEIERAPFYLTVLNEAYQAKKTKNSKYSLRSFARFLNINPGTMSHILSGKREVPLNVATNITKKLNLNAEEKKKFLQSLSREPSKIVGAFEVIPDQFHVLFEEWEYFVILALFRLDDFQSSYEWIAKKANLSLERTKTCVDLLFKFGLIFQNIDGTWKRKSSNLTTTHNVPSPIIKESHKVNLKLALDKLESVPVDERDYSFITVALDEKRLKMLKKQILKFRDAVFKLDEVSSKTKIHRISVQCFPLSNTDTER